jgi:uncharacterized membrane protein YbhN (UPF0104 family)
MSIVADFASAPARLAGVSLPLLAAGLGFQALGLVLRGLAWRNILRAAHPDRRVPAGAVIGAYVTGVAANGILPAKGGEVAKVVLARRAVRGSSTPTIVAALGVLSLFDAVVGLAIIAALIATGTVPGMSPGRLVSVDPRLAAAGAAALLVLGAAIGLSSGLHRRLRRAAGQAVSSLAVLRSPGTYVRTVAGLQAAAWGCRLGVAATLLDAFGIRPTPATAATVVVLGGLAGLVPGAPGGLGSQQLVLAYALGATAATASIVVFSVGMQVAIASFQVVLGLGALMLVLRVAHPLRAVRELRTLARDGAAA